MKKACQILDEGFEGAFQYTIVGKGNTRLKSTNLIERLNQEIRRLEKVVRTFPNANVESVNRLIRSMLLDIHEEWINYSKKYI